MSSPPDILWTPHASAREQSALGDFAAYVKTHHGFDWQGDYHALYDRSLAEPESFWESLWEWHGINGDKGDVILADPNRMTGGQFFPHGTLNYTQNILGQNADSNESPAIISHSEDGTRRVLTRMELAHQTRALAGWLKARGIAPGDRIAAYTPNIPEAVITALAAAQIGAVFSSCSPDFGATGAADRFRQIAPKLLMAADGYLYGGKRQERMGILRELLAGIDSIESVLLVPFLDSAPDCAGIKNATLFNDALDAATPFDDYPAFPFNHPLYILYSSGTTGAPKCIVHGAGGTLLQHIKEHRLHCDMGAGDRVFYFTTCGWMMWNWLVGALATGAAIVLYEGNPFHPGPERLWQMAAAEGITSFGISAKYIDAVRKSGYRPGDENDLAALRQICSTGSPLTEDGFAFVYDGIKADVHLASICGGTDLISCFVLGCPTLPVYAGEIQVRGLGMAVEIFDENGKAMGAGGDAGELVCTAPFPSMPIGFFGDEDGSKYRAAYFEHFNNAPRDVWRHGDWASLTSRRGIIVHGRSDATLNPGGVRIGTAEIYRLVEAFDEVAEAIVIGQRIADDTRVVLFLRLADKAEVLDDDLRGRIAAAIREHASPRHVPEVILQVADIPRTRSGKISEMAVRAVAEGRDVKNTEALANPEALEHFRNRAELAI